jgi:hypothetical protein
LMVVAFLERNTPRPEFLIEDGLTSSTPCGASECLRNQSWYLWTCMGRGIGSGVGHVTVACLSSTTDRVGDPRVRYAAAAACRWGRGGVLSNLRQDVIGGREGRHSNNSRLSVLCSAEATAMGDDRMMSGVYLVLLTFIRARIHSFLLSL